MIRAERVWKRFKADRRRMLLRDELERTVARLRGGPNLGHRWVLRDIDFEVAPGEAVGLIGSNGSGKSTLLKILTRVMYPHTGRVVAQGRVGALIEVRAGIHPDLSGRENIYLYGSLLGLTRRQVAARFDDIVAFAEVEEAIDRQVKFYSSGMQMRLGFAVAAFLEPDILLVDEVLAVGDASFQQKCLNRMRTVLAEGTTLVFVSHDLAAVEATCSRGLWLDRGVIRSDGPVREVLGEYRGSVEEMAESGRGAGGVARVTKVSVSGSGDDVPRTSEPFDVQLVIDSPVTALGRLFLGISEGTATPIFVLKRDLQLVEGETEVHCRITTLPLPRGRYFLWLGMFGKGPELIDWHPAAKFDVSGPPLGAAPRAIVRLAPIHVDASWEMARR
jgi:ABC-type polysaccharide/polyol phosphate transport system ATPase subunit